MRPVLSDKQRNFLNHLVEYVGRHGRTPSLREAARRLGTSHSSVVHYLKVLEKKGYLRRAGRYSRQIELLDPSGEVVASQRGRRVPIIGRIAAGTPIYAQQEWDGGLVVDREVFKGEHLFALRVKGDSMIEAGILDGDLVICRPRQFARNGEIVVALLGGEEATVKYFFLHPDCVELRPANRHYSPRRYSFDDVLIQGKVIGLQRGPEHFASL